jgi:soluble cytochrome b562
MRKRIVIGACFLGLMGSAAHAVDDQAGVDACTEELARVEGLFHDKIEGANSPNEAMVEKASMLLDDADAQCTEGKLDEAKATLAAVTKLVTAPDQ